MPPTRGDGNKDPASKHRVEDIKNYFDSIAGRWSNHIMSLKEREFDNRTISPVLDCIEKIAEQKKDQTFYFLDVGCGSGYWGYKIMNSAYLRGVLMDFKKTEVWFLDISPLMLEEAKYNPYFYSEYSALSRFMNREKLEFKFVNMDLNDLDTIEHPHFDFTFFHKVLSMLEYGEDVQKIFSTFSKSTEFLLTSVKSRMYYNQKIVEYLNEKNRCGESADLALDGDNYFDIEIPMENTKLIARQLKDSRWIVNDDARLGGKNFFEYTYDSYDLERFHKNNYFKIIPSYREGNEKLLFVGKPVQKLDVKLGAAERQDWYPLIQTVAVSRSSPYSSVFPE